MGGETREDAVARLPRYLQQVYNSDLTTCVHWLWLPDDFEQFVLNGENGGQPCHIFRTISVQSR